MDNKWVQFALKWIWPFILILVVIFTILKPSISGLTSYVPPAPVLPSANEGGSSAGSGGDGGMGADGMPQLGHQGAPIPMPQDHSAKVDFAQSMVQQDPKRVADVVKDWIGNES